MKFKIGDIVRRKFDKRGQYYNDGLKLHENSDGGFTVTNVYYCKNHQRITLKEVPLSRVPFNGFMASYFEFVKRPKNKNCCTL